MRESSESLSLSDAPRNTWSQQVIACGCALFLVRCACVCLQQTFSPASSPLSQSTGFYMLLTTLRAGYLDQRELKPILLVCELALPDKLMRLIALFPEMFLLIGKLERFRFCDFSLSLSLSLSLCLSLSVSLSLGLSLFACLSLSLSLSLACTLMSGVFLDLIRCCEIACEKPNPSCCSAPPKLQPAKKAWSTHPPSSCRSCSINLTRR